MAARILSQSSAVKGENSDILGKRENQVSTNQIRKRMGENETRLSRDWTWSDYESC